MPSDQFKMPSNPLDEYTVQARKLQDKIRRKAKTDAGLQEILDKAIMYYHLIEK